MKYALVLNDMRLPNVENILVVKISDNRQELVDWYNDQLAEKPWIDGGRWQKVFKKGSDLEWYNRANLDLDNDYWGGIWKVRDNTEVGMGLVKGGGLGLTWRSDMEHEDDEPLYAPPPLQIAGESLELRERLASIEHERWADWQEWVHKTGVRDGGGNLIIASKMVRQWDRQISTPYEKLSEREQASDMEQVDRYWTLIKQYVAAERQAAVGEFAERVRLKLSNHGPLNYGKLVKIVAQQALEDMGYAELAKEVEHEKPGL